MFSKEIYKARRTRLCHGMVNTYGESGIMVFVGGIESPVNYPNNTYRFRQDSSFLYFWGLNDPCLCAILDLDNGSATLYGDDVTVDDIIWMGPQKSMAEKAFEVAVEHTAALKEFDNAVAQAVAQGRKIHYLAPYQAAVAAKIAALVPGSERSLSATKQVISMRLVKEDCEIEALKEAAEIGYQMHMAGFNAIAEGVSEKEIAAKMEEVTIRMGWGTSFTTICSQHGETLHNPNYTGRITSGKLLLIDAGAESSMNYCSDFTRTYPCSGTFTTKQKEIYDIVLGANDFARSIMRPEITFMEVHAKTVCHMLEGLRDLGLVSGETQEMLEGGVGYLFMPHGLGHNMGLDVHDMEGLDENLVGYDEGQKRSEKRGLKSLRMARTLKPGHVVTDEPGIYFIPDLIKKYRAEGIAKDMINYSKLESYYDFGGIRIEDDILITENGCCLVGGKRLPV